MAQATCLPLAQVREIREGPRTVASLDAPVGEDGDTSLGTLFAAEQHYSDDEELELKLRREALLNALGRLDARERRVLILRYGLEDVDPRTLVQIAEYLGVTRERVRQIERRALEQLAVMRELETLGEAA